MTLRHWLAFLAVGVFAGSSFAWNKLALAELSPLGLLWSRYVVATLFLGGVAAVFRPGWPPGREGWWALAAMGVFNVALPHLLIAWGLQSVDSAMAGILNATTPLFTLFIAHFLLSDDRLSPAKLAGAATSFAGVVVVLSHNLTGGLASHLLGQLSVLGASLSFAASTVMARRFAAGTPPLTQALLAAAFAALTTGVAAGAMHTVPPVPTRPLTWVAVTILGTFNSGVSYVLFFYLLNTIGPSRTQAAGYLIPFVAVVIGVVFLGEALHWRLALGGVLIVGGIALVQRSGLLALLPAGRHGEVP